MKAKKWLTLILFLISPCIFSQNLILNPVVDERVELLSIVFRLAGANEYSITNITDYSNSIDTYFNSYKEDELIKFAQEVRKKNGVAYDAVMSMATHVEIINGDIRLKENIEKQSLDSRWGTYTDQFLVQLNNFYKKTNFHKFYSENEPLYAATAKRFSETIKSIDLTWFEKYFGKNPLGRYYLIISLVNGRGNYGPKISYTNGNEDIYSIIGVWNKDSLGFPVFEQDEYNGTIVHEFNHSFCNNLIDRHYIELEKSADAIYKLVKRKMQMQAYGVPKTMYYETLVRATTIMYFRDHKTGEKELNKMIACENLNGFICIKPLFKLLEQYRDSSAGNKNSDWYMPQIVSLLNSLDPHELEKNSECTGTAKIVDFSIKNNSTDVDPDVKELILKFNQPMSESFGLSHGKGGKKCFPNTSAINWNKEKMDELIISLKLEPGKKYSVKFPGKFFLDENYCGMKESYILNFKTK